MRTQEGNLTDELVGLRVPNANTKGGTKVSPFFMSCFVIILIKIRIDTITNT